MALNLDDLRYYDLNPDLGITDDTLHDPWGDESVRMEALEQAVRRLWPRMARLMREDIPIIGGADSYEIYSLWDVEVVEVLNPAGRVYKEIRNFRQWVDHTDAADEFLGIDTVRRLELPIHWQDGTTDTLRALGYKPYDIWDSGGG